MRIEQAANAAESLILSVFSDFAPIIIEIIILVTVFNFIGLLKKMISGIEQNVFLIVQQNARIEQELKKLNENRGKEENGNNRNNN